MCGQNDRGQLGLGHNADISTLQLCPSLSQKVTQVACGWDFTLLLAGKHDFSRACDALRYMSTSFRRSGFIQRCLSGRDDG